jgi:hypothetical protein
MDVIFPLVSEGFEGQGIAEGQAGSDADSSTSTEGIGTTGIIIVVVVVVGILLIGVITCFVVRK